MTLSKDDFINLSKLIFRKILDLKKQEFRNEVILNRMLNESTLTYLLENINIRYNEKNREQVQRLLEVMSFALLKSSSYHCLINDLVRYTKKTIGTIRTSIKTYLKIFSIAIGLNVEQWEPEIIYGIKKYTEDDVKWWKELYEEMGSYNSVKEHIRKVIGEGPADTTIKERLKKAFRKEGNNFEIWEKRFKRNIKIQKYRDKEVEYWINLYEEIGSFNGISDYLYNNYEKITSSSTIKKRIHKKFIRESRNFDEWVEKFRADKSTTFKSIYNEEEVSNWVKLFEKYGIFNKVSKFIKKKQGGFGPDSAVIKYRIQKKYKKEGRDFEKWFNKYNLDKTGYFERIYTKEEVEEWERLFEDLGSFNAVSEYLEMISENTPHRKTIAQRLKQKFKKEGRNFKRWVIEFFSPNHERANNIGRFIHNILELIFIEFCIEKGYKGYYEISPTMEKETIIDNALIDLDCHIKMINIDYTITKYLPNITNKLYKNYQSTNRALFIVLFTVNDQIRIPKNVRIPHQKNVKFIHGKEFALYMGYYGRYLRLYNNIMELAKEGFFDDSAYNELESLSKMALMKLEKLTKKFPISQNDLINYLIKNEMIYILKDLKFKELDFF